jgi:hypothetical protein
MVFSTCFVNFTLETKRMRYALANLSALFALPAVFDPPLRVGAPVISG